MGESTRRLAILLPDLRPGGAERLHLALASDWLAKGIAVEFVLRRAVGELLDVLPTGARVVGLGADRVRHMFRPLASYLSGSPPDALLSAMWPLTAIAPSVAFSVRFRGRVVVSEHSPQSLANRRRGLAYGLLMRVGMGIGYRVADARVAVSAGVAHDMAMLSGLRLEQIDVVNNPAAIGRVIARSDTSAILPSRLGPVVLSVGTLKPVKRHDLLLRAFAMLDIPGSTLVILGEGEERRRLEALAGELGIAERVHMPGYQADPLPWYSRADLFVLASDYEGFGNVIVEALEQGTPVVSTDCPVGPREILAGGRYGALVPVGDAEALAGAMGSALARSHDREALMRRAADFSLEKASTAYLDLLLPGWRGGVA